MTRQKRIHVVEASQVGEARRAAVRTAEEAGLDEIRQGQVAIVATELANNLVRHARGGDLFFQSIQSRMGKIVEILTCDTGPGMINVERCLQDGFSTAGSPGNGLGAVRRLSREFDIYSELGQGTVVLSRIDAFSTRTASDKAVFEWGGISIPAPKEEVSGDEWALMETDKELAIMIADGLGHGLKAFEAANIARRLFEKLYLADSCAPKNFIEEAHRALKSTRGAAIAAGYCKAVSEQFAYSGVGNISGTLFNKGGKSQGLLSHNGTVGVQSNVIRELEYSWPVGSLLIMHSDGLQTRWSADNYKGLFARHPGVIAATLCRDFKRGPDDVTVVVVRRKGRFAN
jgi:anti-sigma regulatory factor (Ser/Thr protein kinase)